jgi:hypothetical protein
VAVTSEVVAFSSRSLSVCSGEGIAKLEVLKGTILPSHNRRISGFHSVPQRQFIGSTAAVRSLIKVADAVVGPKTEAVIASTRAVVIFVMKVVII